MASKNSKKSPQSSHSDDLISIDKLVRRHLLFGWTLLVVFVGLGLFLESLHAFKATSYLGADTETRRLMWTLSHSHGTLISLIQIVFALTLGRVESSHPKSTNAASLCLIGANLLMPVGFFLGGLQYYSSDPGLGVLLVPPGGIMLFIGVALTAKLVFRSHIQR